MTASHARSQLRQCPGWSHWPGSNRPPARYECAALPNELQWLAKQEKILFFAVIQLSSLLFLHFFNELVDVVILVRSISINGLG